MSPSFWSLATASEEHGSTALFEHAFFRINTMIVTQWAIMLVLVLIAFAVGRNLSKVPRTRIQGMMEMLLEFLEGWLAGFIGGRKEARRFLPLLGSFFMFILISNYSGLLPGAGSGFIPPTSKWGTTAGLGLVVMFSVVVIGIRDLGFLPWLKHLLGLEYGFVALMMGILHILEEFFVRPFSLSLRLFGNIFAEETLLHQIFLLAPLLVPLPIMGLSLLFGGIQAIVFTTLSAIYIGGVVEAARHHAHAGHGHAAHDAAAPAHH